MERSDVKNELSDTFATGNVRLDDYPAYVPLREAVFGSLKKAILDGVLKPGQMIVENRLASELAVSRTPVREAIRMLESEGLVTLLPGRKAMVSVPTPHEVEDIYEIRLLVETEALRRITPERTELIGELEAYTQQADEYLQQGDIAEMGKINTRFHLTIISAFNNEKLQQIVTPLHDTISRFLRYTLLDREWAEQGNSEHKQIVAYAKNGDTEEAVALMVQHLTAAKRVSADMVHQMTSENNGS